MIDIQGEIERILANNNCEYKDITRCEFKVIVDVTRDSPETQSVELVSKKVVYEGK